jgi:hypothetical protein
MASLFRNDGRFFLPVQAIMSVSWPAVYGVIRDTDIELFCMGFQCIKAPWSRSKCDKIFDLPLADIGTLGIGSLSTSLPFNALYVSWFKLAINFEWLKFNTA